jgi:endonuclease/exonuclease/phosphatase (EEP) superfamily protein YafD
MRIFKITITALSLFVVVVTFLPFIRTDAWWVRVCDFPRLQIAVVGIFLALALLLWRGFGSVARRRLLGSLLLITVAVQGWHLFPYTSLSPKQVLPANAPGPEFSVLVANVLQENRESHRLIQMVDDVRPDLVVLCEVNQWWTGELEVLHETHPHSMLHPQENGYGLHLFSRFPLHEPEVRFLTDPAVPSFHVGVEVNGEIIRFFAVHPRPPGRVEASDGPRDSGQRDAELVLIAREVQEIQGPVIVAGDFNDVAWSHTTRLFQRLSRLLDPRVGRGLYNTYHVRTPLLRFPLDHLFHSDHFRSVDLRRLDSIGSDHFPMLVGLRFQDLAAMDQEAPPEKPADDREAAEIVAEELHETE